jgi:hypothetical protein
VFYFGGFFCFFFLLFTLAGVMKEKLIVAIFSTNFLKKQVKITENIINVTVRGNPQVSFSFNIQMISENPKPSYVLLNKVYNTESFQEMLLNCTIVLLLVEMPLLITVRCLHVLKSAQCRSPTRHDALVIHTTNKC